MDISMGIFLQFCVAMHTVWKSKTILSDEGVQRQPDLLKRDIVVSARSMD
jgi:hypothetical protein